MGNEDVKKEIEEIKKEIKEIKERLGEIKEIKNTQLWSFQDQVMITISFTIIVLGTSLLVSGKNQVEAGVFSNQVEAGVFFILFGYAILIFCIIHRIWIRKNYAKKSKDSSG